MRKEEKERGINGELAKDGQQRVISKERTEK